jgi:hypothetical protein
LPIIVAPFFSKRQAHGFRGERQAAETITTSSHDFRTAAEEGSDVTPGRSLAIIAFALFTAACIFWLGLLWISVHLLGFPCDSPEDPRPCSKVVPWFFATRGLVPTAFVWALAAWATFRRSGKR